jgi:uncharacterized protein YqeY
MSECSLKDTIKTDVIAAMRAKEKEKLGTLRMLQAAVKQREIDERIVLDDSDIVTVVDKMIKQRRDSAKQFQDAGRNELADKELAEIIFLEPYMPSLLSEDEVITLIEKTVQSTGANSMKDMGKLMAELKPQLQGRADIGQVSQKIKKLLS